MKITGKSLLVVTTLALTALARAATFDFSYTFGDGTLVTGRFDGVQNGVYAENVAHVQLAINGTQVGGPLFTAALGDFGFVDGPVISYDGALNNFLFINSDLVNFDFGYDSYFTLRSPAAGDVAGVYSFPAGADFPTDTSEGLNVSAWTMTANAPDGASTAALLGLATLGLFGVRRWLLT